MVLANTYVLLYYISNTNYHKYNNMEFISSVSPKGQVTIPLPIRKKIGIKAKDKVAVKIEGDEVKIRTVSSRLEASYQAVPALKRSVSIKDMIKIAREEHSKKVSKRI